MHYILDGYNIINSSDLFIAKTLEGRRNKLIDFIISGRPHGSHRNSVTIVFDCKSKNPYDSSGYNKSHIGEIEIIFSDGVDLADDIIADIVDNSENAYDITVITNDKGIRRRIAPSGAKYESTESFIAKGFKKKNIKRSREVLARDIREEINKEFEDLWVKKRK